MVCFQDFVDVLMFGDMKRICLLAVVLVSGKFHWEKVRKFTFMANALSKSKYDLLISFFLAKKINKKFIMPYWDWLKRILRLLKMILWFGFILLSIREKKGIKKGFTKTKLLLL